MEKDCLDLVHCMVFSFFNFSDSSKRRHNVTHKGMVKNFDPCESFATMHLWIRQLEHEAKFGYNYNSAPAYDDGIPIWWPGKKKGPAGQKAYKKAKKDFQKEAELNLGLPIGISYLQF